MKTIRFSTLAAVCVAAIQFSDAVIEPLSAQVYYTAPFLVNQPVQPLPGPNYVVYSPTFLAWRSSGFYGGNWGPYYYAPEALYPVIPGNAIWPIYIPAQPPVAWPYR